MSSSSTGVALMTYGSATTSANVEEFLNHVYPDGPEAGLVAEFKRRFDIVGGSPLVRITVDQGAALQKLLDKTHGAGRYHVRVGLLHSEPFIAQALAELKLLDVGHVVGLILSPQFSDFIMGGYTRRLTTAAADAGFVANQLSVVGPWPDEPHYIELISHRLQTAHRRLIKKHRQTFPIIFTTHSLPERVVAQDPAYLWQLEATMQAVVRRAGLAKDSWTYAYQSAGHTPEPWLKPDLVDILAELRPQKAPAVLIVPLQFLADHLEILYDLDTAAAEQCAAYGIEYNRIELPNTHHLFIEALADLVIKYA